MLSTGDNYYFRERLLYSPDKISNERPLLRKHDRYRQNIGIRADSPDDGIIGQALYFPATRRFLNMIHIFANGINRIYGKAFIDGD